MIPVSPAVKPEVSGMGGFGSPGMIDMFMGLPDATIRLPWNNWIWSVFVFSGSVTAFGLDEGVPKYWGVSFE